MKSLAKFVAALILTTICPNVLCKVNPKHPEVDLNIQQRIRRHGYPVEAHKIVTDDGFILPLYHIPHGLEKSSNTNKSSVLIMHGMGGSPQNFIILGSKRSIPYYLADRDYDVWLFAARGLDSPFKEKHIKYDWDKDDAYWLYSIHEMGVYDLASSIDYILNYTGQVKVSLIGHSAGGNTFYCLLSDKPEYNDKVKIAINWASSPILKRTDYPFGTLIASMADAVKGLSKIMGTAEMFPMLSTLKPLVKTLCADSEWVDACMKATWAIGSHKSFLQHIDDIQVIVSNLPRMSNQQMFHFMDNYNSNDFRKYNYGPKKNLKLYGQKIPPKYNLTAVTAAGAFFVGPRDSIITLKDVYESASLLPNVVLIHLIEYDLFTHTDYIFGRNATELVYEPTYQLLRNIDQGNIPPPIKILPEQYL